jgi:quinoprotein glucose dehydrogenase
VIALDAATGKELWKFSDVGAALQGPIFARGVTFWDAGSEGRRVFASASTFLYCLDARSGQLVRSFGNNGSIHLGEDLDIPAETTARPVALNTPGVIYKDMLIIGSNPGEGGNVAPGHIRAYDARTGKRRWIFHTIPHPGEPGYETWPPEYY